MYLHAYLTFLSASRYGQSKKITIDLNPTSWVDFFCNLLFLFYLFFLLGMVQRLSVPTWWLSTRKRSAYYLRTGPGLLAPTLSKSPSKWWACSHSHASFHGFPFSLPSPFILFQCIFSFFFYFFFFFSLQSNHFGNFSPPHRLWCRYWSGHTGWVPTFFSCGTCQLLLVNQLSRKAAHPIFISLFTFFIPGVLHWPIADVGQFRSGILITLIAILLLSHLGTLSHTIAVFPGSW